MHNNYATKSNLAASYDVIVVGAGHAGCEAAIASARLGARTLLISSNLDKVATLPCNPSIGGPGKGHLVREIGALGGVMAGVADVAAIQIKQLNTAKGPAVQAYRAQIDKGLYNSKMLEILRTTKNLDLLDDETIELIAPKKIIQAVVTKQNGEIGAKAVIICAGTFLNGEIIVGNEVVRSGGRIDEPASIGLSASLVRLGLKHGRLKTGTPPRIYRASIDYNKLETAPGSSGAVSFSYPDRELMDFNSQEKCFLTYTNEKTHKLVMDNLADSPVFSGMINERAPRSCPSLDLKVANFPDRNRHPIFIEPEGRVGGPDGVRMYIQGGSLAFPPKTQEKIIRSIVGLEKAQFLAYGYAVVYDYFMPHQLRLTLETKLVQNLYLAGQMNGTTGYEEAAAQGLIAGINAARKTQNKSSLILDRTQAYIGVLIEDLVTKIHIEPYRMFTSRAEYRLLLRNDNADLRLSEIGHQIGLLDVKTYSQMLKIKKLLAISIKKLRDAKKLASELGDKESSRNITAYEYLTRPEIQIDQVCKKFNLKIEDSIKNRLQIEVKYSGYLKRQQVQAEKLRQKMNTKLSQAMNYDTVKGLRNEARIRLKEVQPVSLAQAAQIQGVTPADLSLVLVASHTQRQTATIDK